MAEVAANCPNSKIVIVGYSEGADVVGHAAANIGAGRGAIPQERLGAVISIGSPSRSMNSHVVGTSGPGEGFFAPLDYGTVAGQVYELCDKFDTVCNGMYTAPVALQTLVNELAGRRFFTPDGFQQAAAGIQAQLGTPEGAQIPSQ